MLTPFDLANRHTPSSLMSYHTFPLKVVTSINAYGMAKQSGRQVVRQTDRQRREGRLSDGQTDSWAGRLTDRETVGQAGR